MHKLFDKFLASRISEVFHNHQEAYKPDDWEKLYAKMNQGKTKTLIMFPFIAKAATVALLLGLSVFTVNDKEQMKERNIDFYSVISNENVIQEDSTLNQVSIQSKSASQDRVIVRIDKENRNKGFGKLDEQIAETENIDTIVFVKSDTLINKTSYDLQIVDIKKDIETQKEEIKKINDLKTESPKSNLLYDYSEFEVVENEKKENRFDFGVEVTSVTNYANEGEGSGFNLGGGISTSWHISKNFSFSTGMLLAHQSMDYSQNQSSNRVLESKDAIYAAPNSIEMVDLNTAESTVEFLGIDIPLNVQFKHKRIILTTGVSSLLYVQEKFSYSYNSIVTNTKYNTVSDKFETQNSVNQVETQEKSEIFSRFDFARLINLAVGYQIPLSKGDLVFEPYVKLPIGNISSYDIKMGSGGFAVRYNF